MERELAHHHGDLQRLVEWPRLRPERPLRRKHGQGLGLGWTERAGVAKTKLILINYLGALGSVYFLKKRTMAWEQNSSKLSDLTLAELKCDGSA